MVVEFEMYFHSGVLVFLHPLETREVQLCSKYYCVVVEFEIFFHSGVLMFLNPLRVPSRMEPRDFLPCSQNLARESNVKLLCCC